MVQARCQNCSTSVLPDALKQHLNHDTTAYAFIRVDKNGVVGCDVSASLRDRLDDLFTPTFRQDFLRFVDSAQEEAEQPTVEQVSGQTSSDRRCKVATSSTHIGTTAKRRLTSPRRSSSSAPKRNRSDESARSVKREPCAAQSSISVPTPGREADEEESDDECRDTKDDVLTDIEIGNDPGMKRFFAAKFEQIQQLKCKIIAKSWIKCVEPQKQAKHPYNGGKVAKSMGRVGDGTVTMPSWWPANVCRHIGPDHVKKHERVNLLVHILCDLFVEGITVEKLRTGTNGVLGLLAQDPEVVPLLDQIYHAREKQESFLRGERDATCTISVFMPRPRSKRSAKRKNGKSKKCKVEQRNAPSHEEPAQEDWSTLTPTSPSGQLPSAKALLSPLGHMEIYSPPTSSGYRSTHLAANHKHVKAESQATHRSNSRESPANSAASGAKQKKKAVLRQYGCPPNIQNRTPEDQYRTQAPKPEANQLPPSYPPTFVPLNHRPYGHNLLQTSDQLVTTPNSAHASEGTPQGATSRGNLNFINIPSASHFALPHAIYDQSQYQEPSALEICEAKHLMTPDISPIVHSGTVPWQLAQGTASQACANVMEAQIQASNYATHAAGHWMYNIVNHAPGQPVIQDGGYGQQALPPVSTEQMSHQRLTGEHHLQQHVSTVVTPMPSPDDYYTACFDPEYENGVTGYHGLPLVEQHYQRV